MAEWMLIGEASRVRGVSPEYLRMLADRGDIPVTRTARGVRLFRREDVEALRDAREREAAERDAERTGGA